MTRTRASAKKAGTSFETLIAGYLAQHVDDRIERRTKSGAKDRGDIGGLRHHGHRLVLECKNTAKTLLGPWATEAEVERGNDDALAGLIVTMALFELLVRYTPIHYLLARAIVSLAAGLLIFVLNAVFNFRKV